MKKEAIQKIKDGLKNFTSGSRYANAMKDYIAERLEDFCNQNEEFAQAVVQGGSISDCLNTVGKAVKGNSISDLDATKAAVQFFFPGAEVEFQMKIRMSKFEAETEKPDAGGILLRLEDFLV